MKDYEKAIKSLIEKAKDSEHSENAIKFSQAALNVAHTRRVLFDINFDKQQINTNK